MLDSVMVVPADRLSAPLDFDPGVSACIDRPLTVKEFCDLVDEDTNAELVEGIIVMGWHFSDPQAALFGFMHNLLSTYAHEIRIGRVRGPRTLLRITRHTARMPDLLFVHKDRLDIVHRNYVSGGPDIVVEIVSTHDRPSELVAKQAEYEAVGAREFWLIDQPKRTLKVFDLNAEGEFVQRHIEGGILEAKTVPGFRIQVDWLWSGLDQFPSTLAIVQDLLSD